MPARANGALAWAAFCLPARKARRGGGQPDLAPGVVCCQRSHLQIAIDALPRAPDGYGATDLGDLTALRCVPWRSASHSGASGLGEAKGPS